MPHDTQPHPPTVGEGTDPQHRELARRDEQQRRAFHIHASVFAASTLGVVLINAALNAAAGIVGEWWAWWSVLVLLGWGVGLSIHGSVVRLARAGRPGPTSEGGDVHGLSSP